jgi:hypothetical protein
LKTKVLFYYPQYFNREKGENLFFKPFIEVCEKHNINYLLVEEPDKTTNVPRNKAAYKFDVFFFVILVLRKLLPLKLFSSFEHREQFIGKCINIIALGRFKASVYVEADIVESEMITGENIKSIQPVIKMHPKYLPEILGKTAKQNLEKGERFKIEFIR